jgi:fused signal recognition particle receptor
MFKFLKDKLKQAAAAFSRHIKESIPKEEEAEPKKEPKKKAEPLKKKAEPKKEERTVFESIKQRFRKKEPAVKEKPARKPAAKLQKPKKPVIHPAIKKVEEREIEQPVIQPEKLAEKKGFFARITEKITKTTIDEQKFDDMFWDLELALLENNVAVEVIEKIKQDLSKNIVNVPIQRRGIDALIKDSLINSINGLFDVPKIDMVEMAKKKKPFVIAFFGVNGAGKTTTMAKVARLFEKNRMGCVFAAADTFRAAAIEQLQEHADRLGIKCIRQEYGSDSAAVAFDAIRHAEAARKDVVLIDTAGRTHVNKNLMDELKKVIRVAKPDLKIFVGDALTGNDAVEQAKEFNEAVGIDGIILAKADADEKGGAAVSVSFVTRKPILYLGMGQKYDDLKEFTPALIYENLRFEADSSEEE